jgi:NAD(P)-dependent dehydrogenase (short-subunit alcohol dehydrogenase family)
MKEFKGKVAVITGGASGIGWGLAEKCCAEGMKVVIADVEESALKEAEKKLKARGAQVTGVLTDVSNLTEVEALASKTLSIYGGVHLLFNNAGVQTNNSMRQPVWENPLTDWEWLIGVNLWGVIYGIKVFMPILLDQKTECHVVNTSSMAGLIAESQLVIYAATKAAIIKISEGLYLQLKKRDSHIGVSVLCPAIVTSRLDDAERNRPQHLLEHSESGKPVEPPISLQQANKSRVNIISPEQSADIVFKAIEDNTFYIFTDPLVTRLFKQRADNILAGRNPERPVF